MPWIFADDIEKPALSKKEKEQIEQYLKRRKKPRFYADENFPAQATAILKEMRADVVTVQQLKRSGNPDENHLAQAKRLGRILVTCDRDYLDEKRHPLIHCPALIVFDFGSGTQDEIIRAYRCLYLIFTAYQFFDKWIKIDAKRDEWIEMIRFQDGSTRRERCRIYEGKLQVLIDE